MMPRTTESAIANGDTRTLQLSDDHTNEAGSFTYMVNGSYDMAVLEKLNWFLRDWRLNESVKMDPRLFDILWEVYRESGSHQPIDVLSGYRSPETNAMLRRRSRQVAERSQHMAGKAIDAHFLDVGTARIRDIAMRMQAGGVGFYPVGITPWVHVDSGSVRYWPRMNRDSLARLFPDGKTVFIPSDGQPMPGYDLARAEIEARGGDVLPPNATGGNLFSWLFGGPRGGGSDDADESSVGASTMVASSPVGRGRFGAGMYIATADAKALQANPPAPAPSAQAGLKVADVDAQIAGVDAESVTLRGPAAAQFIAPLPPHKPTDLVSLAVPETPLPPQRPQDSAAAHSEDAVFSASTASPRTLAASNTHPEFLGPSVASTSAPGSRDLILALLKRGQVPSVITKGIKNLPSDALSLAETYEADRPERSKLLAKAATLSAPLPPSRSVDLATSTTTTRALRSLSSQPEASRKSQNPFGAIGGYAFASPAAAVNSAK